MLSLFPLDFNKVKKEKLNNEIISEALDNKTIRAPKLG